MATGGRQRGAWGFLLFFAIVWSGFTVAFLAMDVRNGLRQWRTYGWQEARGRIVAIETKVYSDSDGDTYGVDVKYRYTLAGKVLQGTRVKFGEGSSSDNWAARFVAAHPKGSTVTVYYDPASPGGEAVLMRGLDGQELFSLMFMMPFVCVAVFLWALVLRPLKKGGLRWMKVRERPEEVRIGRSWAMVWGGALAGAASSAFVLTFVMGFGAGFHPTVAMMATAWGVIAAATVAGFVIAMIAKLRGWGDVVVDRMSRVVRVGKQRVEFGDIERAQGRRTERKDSEGGDDCRAWGLADPQKRGAGFEVGRVAE